MRGGERSGQHTLLTPAADAGEEAMPASGGHGAAPGENPEGRQVERGEMDEVCEMCGALRFKLGEPHAV